MSVLFAFLLGAVALFVLYRLAIREVLLDVVKFKIFAMRDELRRRAIDGEINPKGFVYEYLEQSLCKLIALAPEMTLYKFLQFVIWHSPDDKPTGRDAHFHRVAEEEWRKMHFQAVTSLYRVLLINSPIGGLLLFFAYLLAVVARNISKEAMEFYREWKCRLIAEGSDFIDLAPAAVPSRRRQFAPMRAH